MAARALDAETLLRRGIESAARGKLRTAKDQLSRAVARATDVNVRAQANGTLGSVLARSGDIRQGLRLSRDQLALDIDPQVRSAVQAEVGLILMIAGRFAESSEVLTAALDGTFHSSFLHASAYMTRSIVAMRLLDFDGARSDNLAALELLDPDRHAATCAQVQHNLGYLAMLEGDVVEALRLMEAARPAAVTSPAQAAVADLDRAEAVRQAGHTLGAEALLEEAAATFAETGHRQARAEAELQLAHSLLVHAPDRALRVARGAARRLRSASGGGAWVARADGFALRAGFDAGVTDPTAPAVRERVGRVAAELRANGLLADARALEFATAAATARAGQPPARLARSTASDPLDVRLLAHEAWAARATAHGRDDETLRHAAAGLAELSTWHNSFGSLEVRTSLAMHGAGLVREGIRAAVRSDDPEAVFEWSEHARHFSQQVSPVRPPPDPELARDLARYRALRAADPDAAWRGDPEARDVLARLTMRHWATPGEAGVPRAGLDELRGSLDVDSAQLAFVYTGERLLCVVTPTGGREPVIVPLQWSAVEARLDGLRADLEVVALLTGPGSAMVRGALERRLSALSRHLVEPVLGVAGDPRRVVVTAPGVLRGIPWTMLHGLRGRVVTVARSATLWIHGRGRIAELRRAGFAVGPGVARGLEEAETGAAAWRGSGKALADPRVLTGDGATTLSVADLAGEVDVLHIVAHGRHAALAPMFSGVELADGPLFGYDIDRIASLPPLVVLSACEMGRSSQRWGEEAVGMARAWLHAGAQCVIATPVVVADGAACDVLGGMHEGLANGADPAEALSISMEQTGLLIPFQAYGTGF